MIIITVIFYSVKDFNIFKYINGNKYPNKWNSNIIRFYKIFNDYSNYP
jgi:hypothetical protein